jgi:hypothetical protein
MLRDKIALRILGGLKSALGSFKKTASSPKELLDNDKELKTISPKARLSAFLEHDPVLPQNTSIIQYSASKTT